ncbi:MAG: DUF4184 family protein [Chthoniobacterales bacterium]
MPWTLSHPAAVLPLRRFTPKPLDFAALLVGSTTPDVGYYVGRFDLADYAHTLAGSFFACLPCGVILLFAIYLFSRPISYALPSPHRQALLPLCPVFPVSLTRWAILMLSLLLGAWTHNFWDAFTHEHGWFVDRIAWLQKPAIHLPSTTIHVYLVLQEISTVIGFAIVVFAYWWWLRRRPTTPSTDSETDGWRYLLWFAIIVITLLVTLPPAFRVASAFHGFLFYRSFVFRVAIYSPAVAIPLSLISTTVIYACRPRRT